MNIEDRIEEVKKLLANTSKISIMFRGMEYQVEYLIIPASLRAEYQTPIFNYPGGLTHLSPCIEPFLYIYQESIHISPLGYGNSSPVPEEIWEAPFHGADVGLRVLKALGKNKIVLYGHSNSAPIVCQMARRASEFGIEVEEVVLVNPLGLRQIPKLWTAVAFPIFGMLSRLASLGSKHPYKGIRDVYKAPKYNSSWKKIQYELDKSSKPRLPAIFSRIRNKIIVIQSSWDWASFHWPWTKSNEQILRENVPENLLKIVRMPGLHNVTLGKDSKDLAKILEKIA